MATVSASLVRRRVPHVFAIYLGASWALIEFTSFAETRYLLSPHLTDFALATLALLLPGVLIVAWFHGARGGQEFGRVEKVALSTNLGITAVVLFLFFGGTDLGAMTSRVEVVDETGATVEKIVPKAPYLKKLVVFPFRPVTDDTVDEWLGEGVAVGVRHDLSQTPFLSFIGEYYIDEALRRHGYERGQSAPTSALAEVTRDVWGDYFLAGEIKTEAAGLHVSAAVYEPENVAPIRTHSLEGADLFQLIDSLSSAVRRDLGIPDLPGATDRAFHELATASLPAYRKLIDAQSLATNFSDMGPAVAALEEAVEADPTFALAYRMLASLRFYSFGDRQGAERAWGEALRHDYRLPERLRYLLRADYFRARGETDQRRQILETAVKLYPADRDAFDQLIETYNSIGRYEDVIPLTERFLEMNPGDTEARMLRLAAYYWSGRFEDVVRIADSLVTDSTKADELHNIAYTLDGAGAPHRAMDLCERALVLKPRDSWLLALTARVAQSTGDFAAGGRYAAQALEVAVSPLDSATAVRRLRARAHYHGQLRYAADLIEQEHELWLRAASALQAGANLLPAMDVFGMLGDTVRAEQLLAFFKSQTGALLQPYVPLGEFEYTLGLGDLDGARRALQEYEEYAEANTVFPAEHSARLADARGRFLEAVGDYEGALAAYRLLATLDPSLLATDLKIARSLRELSFLDAAEEHLERFLSRRPADPEAHLEMALIRLERGERETAREHLDEAWRAWADADAEFGPARKVARLRSELSS